jgi:hypothetical protein
MFRNFVRYLMLSIVLPHYARSSTAIGACHALSKEPVRGQRRIASQRR